MGKLFNLENPMFLLLNRVADTIILGMLWVAFSIPVVTVGNATFALRSAYRKVVIKLEGKVFPTFWREFRFQLKRGILLTVVFELILLLLAAGAVTGYVYYSYVAWIRVAYVVLGILALMVLLMLLWMFLSVFGKIDGTGRGLSFSYVLLMRHLLTSLVMVALLIGAVALVEIVPIVLLVLPAIYCALVDKLLSRVEKKYPLLWEQEARGDKAQ